MITLRFDENNRGGAFKVLNATNGGPWHKRHAKDQFRSNFAEYRDARIPYSRNHDSGVVGVYGGPFSHDITRMFPRFEADERDPASYDFACTDESVLCTLDAGTETFFRLGQTIEHQIKKHGTLPPADFGKWARICEQVIRHFNEGWAEGLKLGIKYWEIWNEPDLDGDDSSNKRTWGGTEAQFFDLYEITAKHLKSCFPDLKIGGPALAWNLEWAERFLREMQHRGVPIDFFSWHIYCTEPAQLIDRARHVRALLDKYGYGTAESILNEWNYIRGWEADFKYSVAAMHGLKGAAFTMACICEAQACDGLDMLMYYDTRPSAFCGVFDYYSYEPLKGYYPLMWYGKFYGMEAYLPCLDTAEHIYTLCGTDKEGKILCVITNYSEDDGADGKRVHLDFGREGEYEVYLLDAEHDGTLLGRVTDTTFDIGLHSSLLIKQV